MIHSYPNETLQIEEYQLQFEKLVHQIRIIKVNNAAIKLIIYGLKSYSEKDTSTYIIVHN